jgi:hypothetical protein
MNDELIRESFHRQVLQRYQTCSDALVLDELGLCHGKCRADIAVVNGSLTGYEIKSDQDSLERLGEQIKIYSTIFDRAIVITGRKHSDSVLLQLPKWWGVIICDHSKRGGIKFESRRKAQWNKHVDPVAIAQLLWKTEASDILEDFGDPPSLTRQRRLFLYERLAKLMDLTELKRRVRNCLKQRKNWRHLAPLSPSGD